MTRIHDEVLNGYLVDKPRLSTLLRPFTGDFDVTWGAFTRRLGSDASVFFLKPDRHFSEMFGIEREVLLVYHPYTDLQPRTLQLAHQVLQDLPARGRVEPILFFLISDAPEVEDRTSQLLADNLQSQLVVPFEASECMTSSDPYFVRSRSEKYLFSRNLFDMAQPINSDSYYFGRHSFILDLRDATKRGENIGLFGLRKTGKTSLIFKLQRLLAEEKSASLIYVDLQDPANYRLRWWELLQKLVSALPVPTLRSNFSEETGAKRFRKLVEQLRVDRPGEKFIFALDEIEHIAPQMRRYAHWDNDFLEFWKTLRSVQNVNRHICFIVCGVNASVIETPTYMGHDNPLFSMAPIRYMPSFNVDEIRQMVRTLGRVMGLRFSEQCYTGLKIRYGGHPLITRQACSFLNKKIASERKKPIDVDIGDLSRLAQETDQFLFSYGQHVLGVLKAWYPDEYQLLTMLANDDVQNFRDFELLSPQVSAHLRAYELVVGNPPHLAFPFLRGYLSAISKEPNQQLEEGPHNASTPQLEERLTKIGIARNRLEPKIRKFIKRIFLAKLGPERWIDPILASVPPERRASLAGVPANEILARRLFFADLIQIITSSWGEFSVLERGSQESRITKSVFLVLMEYVNKHREDAHAKELGQQETEAVTIACHSIEAALDLFLVD